MSNRIVAKNSVCSVSKNDFVKHFEDVPNLSISSAADIRSKFEIANNILSNTSEDWSKRIVQLKNIRSILMKSRKLMDNSHILEQILNLRYSLESSVRDLRSQIVREAAITCSYIVSTFGHEVHTIGEAILPAAMSQVAVSTKIMASSAATLTEFIVEFIQTRQIFTIIASFSTSKDKSQRRQLAVLLEILIEKWSDKVKKTFIRQLCELVKSSICDADGETRVAGRKAFSKLDETYPEDAEKLYLELEPSKQKMLRGNDAASSAASLNSDRSSSIPLRSKLSVGSRTSAHSHISKFLSQRSSSAIDHKTIKSHVNRLIRPKSTKTMARTDTSPAAKSSTPSENSSRPGSRNRVISISDSREFSPRPLANNDAFFVSFGGSQQIEMNLNDNDDEFLLPIRRVQNPPQKPVHEISEDVSCVLKACYSSASIEKREGVKKLLPIVADVNLNQIDVKNIGNCLNRLLSDVSNSMILEVYAIFVKTHHQKLGDWLRLALVKLFAKKGSESQSNTRKQIEHALNSILESFDPARQLVTVCELMCDPIHLMVPKARVALLEYMTDLLNDYTDRGAKLNSSQVRGSIRKMFAWASDQRQSQILAPHVEKVLCAMFSTNSAEFSTLVAEFDNEQRRWTHQILEKHGLKNGISYQAPKKVERNSEESLRLFRTSERRGDPISLGPFNATINQLEEQSTSRLLDKVNLDSTVNLSGDTFDKLQDMHDLLSRMEFNKSIDEQNEAMANIYVRMCDGSFSMWDQCYAKLLLNLFDILSSSKSEANKKLALRILTKMCAIQASKLFDSTEMAVCKVLDAAVLSQDPTTSLAVEDCLRTLATHLPLSKILNIARVILIQHPMDDDRAALVLKMVTRVFEELQCEEVENRVDDIVPSIIHAYSSKSSHVRKGVVYCLVAIVNRVGESRMKQYFVKLPKAMLNLIQVYINRSISTSLPRM